MITEKVKTSEWVHKLTENLDDKKKVTTPFSNKTLLTTDKVTTSEEVDKGTKKLDDMKGSVVAIYKKYSDNFEGQSKGSTGWFNLDHDFFSESFLHLNRTSFFF